MSLRVPGDSKGQSRGKNKARCTEPRRGLKPEGRRGVRRNSLNPLRAEGMWAKIHEKKPKFVHIFLHLYLENTRSSNKTSYKNCNTTKKHKLNLRAFLVLLTLIDKGSFTFYSVMYHF